jgi:hypothetical protein
MPIKVLIIYYSFTQQTRILVKQFAAGLKEQKIDCTLERLVPVKPYPLPFPSNWKLFTAMVETFLLRRMAIKSLSEDCFGNYDCIILAGPTWSYHASGPVLDFLDRYGEELCRNQMVVPLISCRSYWRIHLWGLKRALAKCGAEVGEPVIFEHPMNEPWRFFGLLLQLRGKMVRKKKSWFRKQYPGYGHSRQQGEEARRAGARLGGELSAGRAGALSARNVSH